MRGDRGLGGCKYSVWGGPWGPPHACGWSDEHELSLPHDTPCFSHPSFGFNFALFPYLSPDLEQKHFLILSCVYWEMVVPVSGPAQTASPRK